MPYYGDALPYYYGGPFSNHSSLMTGTGRTIHSPLGSSRYAPHLSTISESPLSALRRYSPASSSTSTAISSRPKRVIDTADIDVSTPRALSRDNNHQRNRLRRDRPTIRIRSQALKDNPALREHYERHEKTVGELLVEKFLIKDKKSDGVGGGGVEPEVATRPKLYTQVSLDRGAIGNGGDGENNKQREELHEALQKRVTRRMTRRRSSADVQMDPEQLEREVLFALAQADALDTLVAQEQAEIEVETRMGTLIRKNLVRAQPPSSLGKHESQSGGEEDEEAARAARKLAKKPKKRRKTTDKPSPPSESEMDSEAEAARKPTKDNVATINEAVKRDKDGDEAAATDASPSSPGKALKFKVEASNSVGDFSTLWINAAAAEERENQRKNSQAVVEQFRDSVRLPAPKMAARLARSGDKKDAIVEEHQQVVVLPVRKRYVKDDSRNSVYLTLKTPKNGGGVAAKADAVGNVGNVGSDGNDADNARRLTNLLNGSQSRVAKVAKFRSKDNAESDAEVRSISELTPREEGPGERWTKDATATDDDDAAETSIIREEAPEKSISLSSSRDEATSGSCDDNRDALRSGGGVEVSRSRDLGNFRKAASGRTLASREVAAVEEQTRDNATALEKNKDVKIPIAARKNEKDLGKGSDGKGAIGEPPKRIKRSVSALDSTSARAETRLERSVSDGKSAEGEENDNASVASVLSPRSVVESLPNASTINSLDGRVEFETERAVKSRVRGSNDSSDVFEKVFTENSETSENLQCFGEISGKNGEVETTSPIAVTKETEVDGLANLRKAKSKADDSRLNESPKTPTSKKNGNFFKFDEDTKIDGKDVKDAGKVGNKRTVLGKLSSLGGREVDEVRPESPDLKVVPDSPKKVGFQLKKRAIATVNGDKSPLQSPVEKAELSIDAKKKLKREKDIEKIVENLVEKKIAESPKANGVKSPLQSPVEKSDSPIEAKKKLKREKDTEKIVENLAEEKIAESPKANGVKSPLQSPVEKSDSPIEAKKKLQREKDTEKIVENLVDNKIAESPKANGVKSPLQSPVKKSDSPIEAKKKLKREKDTEKIVENLDEKKIAESPKTNGVKSPLQSPVEKSDSPIEAKKKLKREKDTEKIIENLVDKKITESPKANDEPAKLTNGVPKLKLKPIEEIRENRELAKAEKPKLKIWNKPDTPPIQEDDGIDFWGEIASQRVAKPASKAKTESSEIKEAPKIPIPPKSAINTDPELKPNPPSETTAQVSEKEAKLLAGDEKKTSKIKKKKTTESGVCKKKDQEKAAAETILERVISVEGGDEKTPAQQPTEKSSESESSEENSCVSQEAERFERNLSTIAEECSPVAEEAPKIKDLSSLILSAQAKSAEADPSIVSVSKKPSKTASTVASSFAEPEVSSAVGLPEKDKIVATAAIITNTSGEPEAAKSEPSSPVISESSVPTINIEAPGTPPDQEPNELQDQEEEDLPEEVADEEEPEGPGTPTNEAADEAPITKWNGRSDLSLDEPEKEIAKPEVAAVAKKESGKKKTSTTKKKVSKKSSKSSVGSNSADTPGASPDSSKKKKVVKRKKSSSKTGKESDKRSIFERESKVSISSDTTLKPGGLNLRNSPKNSPRNTPKQRPLDLIKMFYTTPASLLTATPRDLSKVRRAKIKKKKHSTRTASASSDSTGSTRSTQSTGTAESTGSNEHDDDAEQKRISSTRSNDSGFDGSPRLSNCDMACHKKCEKLTGNLCGLNQKLVAEALQALKRAPSQSSDNQRNSDGSDHHHASGRITPPATNLPRFKKYTVMDFNFLKVLGKGSFGKVLLAELRRTDCVYAVKCLKKDVVLEDDDVECTLIERKVLTLATRHPYLCHLFCTFQTDSHLFFVMEYLNGGDLMFHIQKSGRFAESRARFYAAEIWSGLNFLHKKGIVYRDLKLDNVLLDFEGHIRIADFGMCKLQIFLDRTADTFCGTPDYMAPEIIKGLKYNQAVDWWSFGVLLYEMLTGQSPFSGCDEDELFWSICNERPFIPRYLSQEAMDVLVCLLEKDAGKRPLAHDISVHPFFHSTQWDRLERRQLEPPFKPALEHTLDTRYFDTAFTAERPRLTPVPEQILTSMDQGVFRGFSYTNPNATD